MQPSRQDIRRAAREERSQDERALTEKALRSLRAYRQARYAERRLIADTKAA